MRPFPDSLSEEFNVFKKLNSPRKIQDFLDTLPINFEVSGGTCRSPLTALKYREVHCIEGAFLAAAAFWYHGERPLLLDLKTTKTDVDHVVALFKDGDRWGAVSKTNHAALRYRDPVYKNVRELAMSYFNEYFTDNGKKTLRSYSTPFNLIPYGAEWLTSEKNLWDISYELDTSLHFPILKKGETRRLRRADPIEIQAGKLVEWKKNKN